MYKSGIRLPPEKHLSLAAEVRGMDEVNEDKAIQQSPIVLDPGKIQLTYLRLLPKNFNNFWWEIDRYKDNWSTSYIFGRRVPYILLLIFGIPAMLWQLIQVGTKRELRNNRSIYHLMMLILIFTYTAIYTVMGAWNLRYHFPVQLGLFIFFAETVFYIINKVRSPSNKFLHRLEASV